MKDKMWPIAVAVLVVSCLIHATVNQVLRIDTQGQFDKMKQIAVESQAAAEANSAVARRWQSACTNQITESELIVAITRFAAFGYALAQAGASFSDTTNAAVQMWIETAK